MYSLLTTSIALSQINRIKPVLLRSTITTVGSTNSSLPDNSYRVLQSVGQSGVVGTKTTDDITLQQGFLNNVIIFNIDNSNSVTISETFDFKIYPNPFVDSIEINFYKKTEYDILIYIYDLHGKLLRDYVYLPANKIRVPLENYQVASYIIKVVSGKKSLFKQIIKKH